MSNLIVTDQEKFTNAKKSALVDVQCPICKKDFQRQKNYVLRSGTSFCSRECASKNKRNQVKTNCKLCNKEIEISPKRLKTSGNFCSMSCNSNFYLEKRNQASRDKKIIPITAEFYEILKKAKMELSI